MHKHIHHTLFFASLLVSGLLFSCKKFITIPPPTTELPVSVVFKDSLTATAAIAGLYAQAMENGFRGPTYCGGMSSDELFPVGAGPDDLAFYNHTLVPTNPGTITLWQDGYRTVYIANALLEGMEKSATISASLRSRTIGEAKFMRAWAHFYLLNLYGDIAYITTTDYQVNTKAPRLPVQQAYAKMIDDLLEAKSLLPDNFIGTERIRVSKWAATAMLARAYLYNSEWARAEAQATEVINNTAKFTLLTDLSKVFLKNSLEAIWQMKPTGTNLYTNEGQALSMAFNPKSCKLSDQVLGNFETGDLRRTMWVSEYPGTGPDMFYASKYKEESSNATGAEYSMKLRLAEQYLIRAEARAKQNNITGANSAESDLNIIRNRAAVSPTTATTQPAMLTAIENERVRELFTEAGHRWFDLKRTGRAEAVLKPLKPSFTVNALLFPLPQSEVLVNQNIKQNPGY